VAALAKAHASRAQAQEHLPGGNAMAADDYGEALALWQRLESLRELEPAHRRDRALARLRRGTLSLQTQDATDALADLEAAGAEFERLHAEDPTDPHLRYSVAESLGSMAHARSLAGEREAAIATLQEALPIHAALVHDFPETPDYAYNHANARLQLGRLLVADRGRIEEAWTLVEQALGDAEKLCGLSPERGSYLRLRASLGLLRAQTFEQREDAMVSGSIEAYGAAAGRLRALAALQPDAETVHCQLGFCLHRLGFWQMRIGRLDDARDSVEAAIAAEHVADGINPASSHHRNSIHTYEASLAAIDSRAAEAAGKR
jgi:tetratricopeptide (TPR) repeat protein